MLETELDYINNYTDELLVISRGLITQNNAILIQLITIFIICSLFKIFIFRKDKKYLKIAIFHTLIIIFPILLLGCITLIVSIEYNSGIEVKSIIEFLLIHYLLFIFFILSVFEKYKYWIFLKLTSINNYFRDNFKNTKDVLNKEK